MILRQVKVKYDKREVVRDFSFSFLKPVTLLLGANGSGKSSLLKAIAAIQHYEGSILIQGKELSDLKLIDRAKLIAYLPQSNPITFPIQVFEYIMQARFPYSGSFNYSKKDISRVDEVMVELDLTNFRSKYLSELSGGEVQRVQIAKMLAQDTAYLLFDEPFRNLDPYAVNSLLKLIGKLSKSDKKVIIATHRPELLPETTFIGLKNGHIVASDYHYTSDYAQILYE